MENSKNIISSHAKLSTIAEIMFFSPFVKNNIKTNPNFSPEEKNFINWYYSIWIFNIIILLIILGASIIKPFYNYSIFSWISNIWCIVIYITVSIPILMCINNVGMRNENEKIRQEIPNKKQVLKAYTPILNFKFWFHQDNYNMPYRWLKESIFLRTIFLFWTLLLWSKIWLVIFLVIIFRLVLLFMNIDIIPLNVKKAINWLFLCNPSEIISYFTSYIISKLKNTDYETTLKTEKQKYQQWQKFWIWIVIQYLLFILIIYFIYRWISISAEHIILLVACILCLLKVFLFYKNKKNFLRVPIISEIVSLVFH